MTSHFSAKSDKLRFQRLQLLIRQLKLAYRIITQNSRNEKRILNRESWHAFQKVWELKKHHENDWIWILGASAEAQRHKLNVDHCLSVFLFFSFFLWIFESSAQHLSPLPRSDDCCLLHLWKIGWEHPLSGRKPCSVKFTPLAPFWESPVGLPKK